MVIDLATLTGAAIRSVGREAALIMSNADKKTNKKLEKSGLKTAEKLIFFPLWKEYKDYLKSDIADIKNIGGVDAGSITAAKFLEHFTNYPWAIYIYRQHTLLQTIIIEEDSQLPLVLDYCVNL